MKACLGQNVLATLPKVYQTAKTASKTLVVKAVPTKVSEKDFKEFLDLNKIIYPKAEHLTSNKNGGVLKMFKLEIKNEGEAEALILQSLTCHITGTLFCRGSPTVQEKTTWEKSGASATKCAVLGTKVAVLGKSNNNNGLDSRRRICAAIHTYVVIVGFIMEQRGRTELPGRCSGFRKVSHRIGTINYWRLVNQFSCMMLKVRKFNSLLGQSALPLAIYIIEAGLIQTPYFILIPVPLWVIYWKFEWEFF